MNQNQILVVSEHLMVFKAANSPISSGNKITEQNSPVMQRLHQNNNGNQQ